MDHLLLSGDQSDLRKQVISHVSSSYRVRKHSNLVFVCGGNAAEDMRPRFTEYCRANLKEFEVFQPEFAMDNLWASPQAVPFDLADFEAIIAELSHAIVVFPEAPGSYAETGYFSAIPDIAQKSILVSNIAFQHKDSFISLGPAKKIAAQSRFQPNIQSDYAAPDFSVIVTRIRRVPAPISQKQLEIKKFRETSSYDLCCVIYCLVHILTVATYDDILYLLRSLYKSRLSVTRYQHIYSIMVGAGYLLQVGQYGHLRINKLKPPLVEVVGGKAGERNEIKLSLAAAYEKAKGELLDLVVEANNAG